MLPREAFRAAHRAGAMPSRRNAPPSRPTVLVPKALEVERYRVGDGEYAVVSFEPLAAAVARLSRAERAVVDALLAGRSNREIAALRGTSPRTVANQLVSAYRKLGVGSRVELAFVASAAGLVGARSRDER